jgi:hypothetical protein
METSAPISLVQFDSISNHPLAEFEGVRAIWSSRERGMDANPRCKESSGFELDVRLMTSRLNSLS